MKSNRSLKGMLLVAGLMFAGAVLAEEQAEMGKKIYERAFGRGCATCHDVQPNPNLFESVNKLSREEFSAVVTNGRNAMPKALDQIMNIPAVKTSGMSQEQAIDALIAYLKEGKK